MSDRNTHVLDLYTRHPISAQQIIAKVRASRGHLENLTPEDLYPHDQDHYGSLSANDALAERASIRRDEHVADFCAGLGGPARYWSRRFGAEVTGIEGEADNFTPAAPCKELVASITASGAPPIEAHWYPGAYHAFDHPNLPERVMTNVKLPPDGHSPTVGSNPEARTDAILKVKPS